jgi:hypothetical protein
VSDNTVEDTGGEARLKSLFQKLDKQLPSVILSIGQEMAAAASSRAPTPEEEYLVMMVGEGNPDGITNLPAMGSASDGDHRMRFNKPEGFYLMPMIAKNYQMIDTLQVGVGSIQELDIASQYTWRNVTGEEYTSTFPFWECWEGGLNGTFEIVPRHAGKKKAPTLKPGLGKENRRVYMTKTIPRLSMFGSINIQEIVDDKLIPAIRNVVREA